MGIKDIHETFKYRGLDMAIVVQSFEVDDSGDVDIEDFEIVLDYVISDDKPHPFDGIALMINTMLFDGRFLQEIIFDVICTEDMDRIEEACRKEWNFYWQDVMADRGLDVSDNFI